MYTAQELKTMQKWSLDRKIQVTQTRLIEWYKYYNGKICISFSGGKDSTVLSDMAARLCKSMDYRLNLTFVDTGLEYPEIRNFIIYFKSWIENKYKILVNLHIVYPKMRFQEVIKKYGYPVISKKVAHTIYYARKGSQWAINTISGLKGDTTKSKFNEMLYTKYKYLLNADFNISDNCCYIMKKSTMNKFNKENDLKPCIATMTEESILRKTNYLKTGCNSFKTGKSLPLSFWTEQDILKYLKDYNIPYCNIYGKIIEDEKGKLKTTELTRTGCMFCMFGVHLEKEPNRFQLMKETHPKQYKYCMEQLELNKVLDFIGVPY